MKREVAIIARIVGRGKPHGVLQQRDYILEPIVPAEVPNVETQEEKDRRETAKGQD